MAASSSSVTPNWSARALAWSSRSAFPAFKAQAKATAAAVRASKLRPPIAASISAPVRPDDRASRSSRVRVLGQPQSPSSASFSYDAITGSASAMSGSATLYCNSGTTITLNTAASASMTLTSPSKSKTLNATYTLTNSAAAGAGTGTFAGADKYVYTVAPSAVAGQWGAPTATDYTGIVDINVTF